MNIHSLLIPDAASSNTRGGVPFWRLDGVLQKIFTLLGGQLIPDQHVDLPTGWIRSIKDPLLRKIHAEPAQQEVTVWSAQNIAVQKEIMARIVAAKGLISRTRQAAERHSVDFFMSGGIPPFEAVIGGTGFRAFVELPPSWFHSRVSHEIIVLGCGAIESSPKPRDEFMMLLYRLKQLTPKCGHVWANAQQGPGSICFGCARYAQLCAEFKRFPLEQWNLMDVGRQIKLAGVIWYAEATLKAVRKTKFIDPTFWYLWLPSLNQVQHYLDEVNGEASTVAAQPNHSNTGGSPGSSQARSLGHLSRDLSFRKLAIYNFE